MCKPEWGSFSTAILITCFAGTFYPGSAVILSKLIFVLA